MKHLSATALSFHSTKWWAGSSKAGVAQIGVIQSGVTGSWGGTELGWHRAELTLPYVGYHFVYFIVC